MSHRHFCDVAGHYWQCEGTACVPATSPDGSWILYLSRETPEINSTTPVHIMRVPASGGPPELVLEGRGIDRQSCARSPANLCVFSEPTSDDKQLIFSAFNPMHGRGRELTRVSLRQPNPGYDWELSRDGSRLAITQFDDREGQIEVLPLTGGVAREVDLKGWNRLWALAWAADGNGLFIDSRDHPLHYLDLEGRSHAVWQQELPGCHLTRGIPSPDGHYLALRGWTGESNVWMLEGF